MEDKVSVLGLLLMMTIATCECYSIFQYDINYNYKIDAKVELIKDVQQSNEEKSSQWSLNAILIIQRIDNDSIGMQLKLDHSSKELEPLTRPFKLKSLSDRESSSLLMQHPQKMIELEEDEPIWSANIKRSIVSLFQIEGSSESGAFVSNEFGIYGLCPTEYYVVNSSDSLYISKIYDMNRCSIPGGIFQIRSNIPINICEMENKVSHAVTSRLSDYKLTKLKDSKYILESINAASKSNVQAFESYYPQFIFTNILIDRVQEEEINDENRIKYDAEKKRVLSDFLYVASEEATGGRASKTKAQIIDKVVKLLKELAEHLEQKELNFDEPYLEVVSEIIRLIETVDLDGLRELYDLLDIGTSYIQETSKNIFLEILPRVGTSSSILLTKHLVTKMLVKPTTAIQLLTALPFFISELSFDLIKECEEFLHVGHTPDVKHSAVLCYSTMIYKAYVAGALTSDQFEKYVKMIFDLFLNTFEYEQQILYLEALGNLQLGNVPNYLHPIIQADYSQTTDIRFLAIFATLPTAYTRSKEVFETYWPIFYSQNTPLQLRIAAFTMLLVSAQTPGRILGLYNVIKNENCPHMINFYRTTILSISESTFSCLNHLKRLVLNMRRYLPPEPPKKYWITGNYIFDYKDRKFNLGSNLQVLLIGDRKRNLPMIAFLKFDTEAMGRFTGQLGIYIKARGLSDSVLDRIYSINPDNVNIGELSNILKLMKKSIVPSTPLHLELIVQYETKTILSYYLNQTTFHDLTEGDIINRVTTILRTDSHLNMQIVRRPFFIKHRFATLLGTPVQILIENTMLASIRGSTTQSITAAEITRKNQIDLRCSSYAVAKILSYNPLEDIEYSTIREQGFVFYLPFNNGIVLNLAEKFLTFSFYRKEKITSGISLKSRTRTFPGNNGHSEKNDIPTHKMNIDDIGVKILIDHNVESSKENLIFLLESDVHTSAKVFAKTPYSIVQNVLTLVSMIQLTSIHIARDKHLTILLTNEPKSKLETTLKWDFEDFSGMANVKEKNVIKVDCSLLHIHDYLEAHPKQLHKWEFSTKYTTFKNNEATNAVMSLNRKAANGERWKLCISSSLDYLVRFKRPFLFKSSIAFGEQQNSTINCPHDKSKIDFVLSIGSSERTNEKFENLVVRDDEKCTKDVLKFSPTPEFSECNARDLLKNPPIADISMNIKFQKMPELFYDIASRTDHLLSVFVPNNIDKLNISEYIDLTVKLSNDEETSIMINDNSLPIPISCPSLHRSYDQMLLDHGFTSICSLYKRNVQTFTGSQYAFDNASKSIDVHENEMLLVAECSESPQIGVFIEYEENSSDFLHVKIYENGKYIIVGHGSVPIVVFNELEYDLRVSPFESNQHDINTSFRATFTKDSIIEIENEYMRSKIQYNMNNLISISLPTFMLGKLCGLCTT